MDDKIKKKDTDNNQRGNKAFGKVINGYEYTD